MPRRLIRGNSLNGKFKAEIFSRLETVRNVTPSEGEKSLLRNFTSEANKEQKGKQFEILKALRLEVFKRMNSSTVSIEVSRDHIYDHLINCFKRRSNLSHMKGKMQLAMEYLKMCSQHFTKECIHNLMENCVRYHQDLMKRKNLRSLVKSFMLDLSNTTLSLQGNVEILFVW